MFRRMQPLQLFATQLYAQEPSAEERRALDSSLTAAVAALPKGRPAEGLQRDPAFAPLVRFAEATGEAVLQRLDSVQRGLEVVRLEALVEPPDAMQPPRSEPNAYLAGFYLLSGAGQWLVQDPRPQAHLLTAALAGPSPALAESLTLPLTPGRLLLFPAYLRHQIRPNTGPGGRVLFRFALSFRDFVERLSPPRWDRLPA